jgi:DNA-binding NarL/FixJ family response regulator
MPLAQLYKTGKYLKLALRETPLPDDFEQELSERQAEILQLYRSGFTQYQIAGQLGISRTSIARYLKLCYFRLIQVLASNQVSKRMQESELHAKNYN